MEVEDVEEWLSVSQLSKILEVPETTTRRYLNNFDEYFRSEQRGRGKKYHPESIEILQRIATLYSTDYETSEIKKVLAKEYAFTVEDSNQKSTTRQPPAYDIPGRFEEFKHQQEQFNKQLLKQLQEQQDYIRENIEKPDEVIQEAKQLVIAQEDKRLDRFNQIMAERKVNRLLEKEAMALWMEKPAEERTKKTGWFRKEEDKEKREIFVKNYVDEHFEAYLRLEFDIDN